VIGRRPACGGAARLALSASCASPAPSTAADPTPRRGAVDRAGTSTGPGAVCREGQRRTARGRPRCVRLGAAAGAPERGGCADEPRWQHDAAIDAEAVRALVRAGRRRRRASLPGTDGGAGSPVVWSMPRRVAGEATVPRSTTAIAGPASGAITFSDRSHPPGSEALQAGVEGPRRAPPGRTPPGRTPPDRTPPGRTSLGGTSLGRRHGDRRRRDRRRRHSRHTGGPPLPPATGTPGEVDHRRRTRWGRSDRTGRWVRLRRRCS
jgi:hypothetical protein